MMDTVSHSDYLFSWQLPKCTSWRATRVRSHGRPSHQWEGILWAMCSRCWWDVNQNTNRCVCPKQTSTHSHTHTPIHRLYEDSVRSWSPFSHRSFIVIFMEITTGKCWDNFLIAESCFCSESEVSDKHILLVYWMHLDLIFSYLHWESMHL